MRQELQVQLKQKNEESNEVAMMLQTAQMQLSAWAKTTDKERDGAADFRVQQADQMRYACATRGRWEGSPSSQNRAHVFVLDLSAPPRVSPPHPEFHRTPYSTDPFSQPFRKLNVGRALSHLFRVSPLHNPSASVCCRCMLSSPQLERWLGFDHHICRSPTLLGKQLNLKAVWLRVDWFVVRAPKSDFFSASKMKTSATPDQKAFPSSARSLALCHPMTPQSLPRGARPAPPKSDTHSHRDYFEKKAKALAEEVNKAHTWQ